jgi:hypothetical protein
MTEYTIYRNYFDCDRKSKIIKTGLTLAQAQAHCQRDDTSSRTHPKGKNGCTCEWFDGYSCR